MPAPIAQLVKAPLAQIAGKALAGAPKAIPLSRGLPGGAAPLAQFADKALAGAPRAIPLARPAVPTARPFAPPPNPLPMPAGFEQGRSFSPPVAPKPFQLPSQPAATPAATSTPAQPHFMSALGQRLGMDPAELEKRLPANLAIVGGVAQNRGRVLRSGGRSNAELAGAVNREAPTLGRIGDNVHSGATWGGANPMIMTSDVAAPGTLEHELTHALHSQAQQTGDYSHLPLFGRMVARHSPEGGLGDEFLARWYGEGNRTGAMNWLFRDQSAVPLYAKQYAHFSPDSLTNHRTFQGAYRGARNGAVLGTAGVAGAAGYMKQQDNDRKRQEQEQHAMAKNSFLDILRDVTTKQANWGSGEFGIHNKWTGPITSHTPLGESHSEEWLATNPTISRALKHASDALGLRAMSRAASTGTSDLTEAIPPKRRGVVKKASDLSTGTEARKHVAKSNFVFKGKAPEGESKSEAKGKYPVPDKAHARAAMGFCAMHHGSGSSECQAVKAKVHAKFGAAKTAAGIMDAIKSHLPHRTPAPAQPVNPATPLAQPVESLSAPHTSPFPPAPTPAPRGFGNSDIGMMGAGGALGGAMGYGASKIGPPVAGRGGRWGGIGALAGSLGALALNQRLKSQKDLRVATGTHFPHSPPTPGTDQYNQAYWGKHPSELTQQPQ